MIRLFLIQCLLFSLCAGLQLTEKSASIANNVFHPMSHTCVLWRHADLEVVDNFLKSYNGLAQIFSIVEAENTDPNEIKKCKQSILLVSDSEDFEMSLYLLTSNIKDIMYMLVVITKPVSETPVLTEFTKTAWENDVGNIIIFSWNEQNNKVNTTTYLPYSNGKCDNYNAVTKEFETNDTFVRKYKNFNRCSLNITQIYIVPYATHQVYDNGSASVGGVDGDVFSFVCEKLNATVNLVEPPVSAAGEYINGTGTGVFGDLVYGKVDVMLPGISINVRRTAVAQITHVYHSLDILWCGPNRREVYPWAKVLLRFFSSKTPFIALAFVLFVVCVLLIEHFGIKKVKFKNIIFGTTALFLGQTMNFERDYWLSNAIFAIWIWFCQVIRVAYQGDLINNFGLVILEPPLTHLKEAIQKVDGFGGSEGYKWYYAHVPGMENYEILTFDDMPGYLNEVSEGRRYLVVVDELLVRYINKPVQILEERMTRMPIAFYIRPRWPATDEADSVLVKVVETGLAEKVLRRFKDKSLIKDKFRGEEVIKPMEFETLSACFYALIFMYLICFLIFCLELCYYDYKKKNQNKIVV